MISEIVRIVVLEGLWLKVEGLWFMVYGLWFMVEGLWFMVEGLGSVVVVETYQRTCEGQGFSVGCQDGWIDDTCWWNNEGYNDQQYAKHYEDNGDDELYTFFHNCFEI